mmetsp:Transcript_26887/g.27363  ORF Transcript_26887/g.27363 Transcript_26887/m.27363 type:complete len:85 (+) Transcript_26887:168-422(+)
MTRYDVSLLYDTVKGFIIFDGNAIIYVHAYRMSTDNDLNNVDLVYLLRLHYDLSTLIGVLFDIKIKIYDSIRSSGGSSSSSRFP